MASDNARPSGAGGSSRPVIERTDRDTWFLTHETVVDELVPLPGSAQPQPGGKSTPTQPGHAHRAAKTRTHT